jgi:hypothetical protein
VSGAHGAAEPRRGAAAGEVPALLGRADVVVGTVVAGAAAELPGVAESFADRRAALDECRTAETRAGATVAARVVPGAGTVRGAAARAGPVFGDAGLRLVAGEVATGTARADGLEGAAGVGAAAVPPQTEE